MKLSPRVVSWLQVAPLSLVLLAFFGIPLLCVIVVSFFDFDKFDIVPGFFLTNYTDLLESPVSYALYSNTLKYTAMVWAITLVLGFTIAYFLAFHVRSVLWQMGLLLLESFRRRCWRYIVRCCKQRLGACSRGS